VALLAWAAAAAVTRFSSVGGMTAAVAAPAAAFALGQPHAALSLAVMAGILIWKHRENIARLRAGTESKIGAK
jgi:glycerol-3-phosphate acyltransferase PlsY